MTKQLKKKLPQRYGWCIACCYILLITTLAACSISISFNASSIDYNKVKTISIEKFPIRCAYVWAPMESMFYNSISDQYANKTKLQVLKRNGDLQ